MNPNIHWMQIKSKLTYANVIATVALFLALGGATALAAGDRGRPTVGTAQLKPGAVTGAKVKNHSLTGADVVASSLGQVPSAAHADSAGSAERAVTAGRAELAGRADSATRADTATRATNADAAASLTPTEKFHLLDEPGEPASGGGAKVLDYVSFYRDHEGIVHLEGDAELTNDLFGHLFDLPPGYQPIEAMTFYGVASTASTQVHIERGGEVWIYGAKGVKVSLDGLTWKADQRIEA